LRTSGCVRCYTAVSLSLSSRYVPQDVTCLDSTSPRFTISGRQDRLAGVTKQITVAVLGNEGVASDSIIIDDGHLEIGGTI
jgi:hypothetical protein